MRKIKDLNHRSMWYKKNFYYLKAGQSLADATKVSTTCEETMQIHLDIMDGLKLSDILSDIDLKHIFSGTEISFIRVAENTGNLEKVFLILSKLLRDQYLQKQKIINALIYPLLIIVMTVVLLSMILFFIIPKIKPLFDNLKTMPVTTRLIIDLSDHIISWWYIDLIIVFFVIATFIFFKDFFIKNRYILFLRIPYIKDIYLYWYIEKWLQIIYMSIYTGVTINDAIRFGYESIDDKYIRDQFELVHIEVNKGKSVFNSIQNLDKHTYTKIKDWESVISSGERTGSFAEVFEICHMNIKESLENSFERMQRMIEPLLIIIIGSIVMIICVSIILPMYQITQSI